MVLRLWGRVTAVKARRQIRELYVFLLFFSFAQALILIFEPIFLYQLKFPLWQIALYYALHYTSYVLLLPWGAKFAARFGYERSMAFSTPILMVYLLALAWLPQVREMLWVVFLLLTLHKIFYWPAYHATFAAFSRDGQRGKEQSVVRMIVFGIGVAGPVIGGIIIHFLGYPLLFVLAALTLIAAVVPLLKTQERYRAVKVPADAGWRILLRKREKRVAWATMGWAEHLVHMQFWPIRLFSILGSPVLMGLITSISVAVMTIWGFMVGAWCDHRVPRRCLGWAALLEAGSHALRAFVAVPWVAVPADITAHVANTSMEVPFLAQVYKNGRESEPLLYSLAFETMLAASKAGMAWVLVIVFAAFTLPVAFMITFLLAALASLLYGVM